MTSRQRCFLRAHFEAESSLRFDDRYLTLSTSCFLVSFILNSLCPAVHPFLPYVYSAQGLTVWDLLYRNRCQVPLADHVESSEGAVLTLVPEVSSFLVIWVLQHLQDVGAALSKTCTHFLLQRVWQNIHRNTAFIPAQSQVGEMAVPTSCCSVLGV